MKFKLKTRHFFCLFSAAFIIFAIYNIESTQASDTSLILANIYYCAYVVLKEFNKKLKELNDKLDGK